MPEETILEQNRYAAALQQARLENARGAKYENLKENQKYPASDSAKHSGHKISTASAAMLLIVAAIVDILSALLNIFLITVPVYWLLYITASLGFFLWLNILGVSWSGAKGQRTAMLFGLALGIELIPIINVLPAWIAFVVGAIINDRGEMLTKKLNKKMGLEEKNEKSGDETK